MNAPMDADQELMERIARGDWAPDVEAPHLDTVTTLVAKRQRQRRTAYGAGVGLVAAAAVTAVVALQPGTVPTSDPPPAAQSTTAGPTTTGPTTTGPTTTPTTPAGPHLVDCTGGRARLLLSHGRYGGTSARPAQVAFVENIGKRACSLAQLPELRVATRSGLEADVDMTSAGDGPWQLQPEEAVIFTVTAPPPSSCTPTDGPTVSRRFVIELTGNTYTFPFAGMTVVNCAPPTLTGLRVGPAPKN